MNRKDFLSKALVAGLGIAFVPVISQCSTAASGKAKIYPSLMPKSGDIQKLRGNVSAFSLKGGTVGVLETKNEFVVIDSQYPDSIQYLLDAVSEKGKPISYLCNTHHHGDHTGGNIAFKDLKTNILAQKLVPVYQRERAMEQKKENEQLYANILFEKEYVKEFSGEKMKAMHIEAGHTFGDTIYHFENDNVAHLGDLIFNNVMPVYRPKDGSNVFSWIRYLEKIESYFDTETQFIFGHGNTKENAIGTKADIAKMKDFLSAAQYFVTKENNDGKTVKQILAKHKVIPGFESHQPLWETHFEELIQGLYTTSKFG